MPGAGGIVIVSFSFCHLVCFSNDEDYADKCLNYDNLLIQYSDYSYEANKILHTIKKLLLYQEKGD